MIARAVSLSSLAAAVLMAACTNYYEIPIETPIRPKLDVSAFQRVLVAGFLSGGSEDVDANLETTRLLRSQLRTKSELRVIDVDTLPLMDVANESRADKPSAETNGSSGSNSSNGVGSNGGGSTAAIKEEKDLETYEHLFANTDYWKRIGEEHQQPLIVTGTIMFTPHQQNNLVQRDNEDFDSFGRRRVTPTRVYVERKGFRLSGRFVFIDGRTGAVLHSTTAGEEILYAANQVTPALSSYFELMDRVIPTFLSTLSNQKVKGTRVLLN
jgi:hypothetical protein